MTRREKILANKNGLGMLLVTAVVSVNGDIVYQAPDGSQTYEFFKAVDRANIWLDGEYVKK